MISLLIASVHHQSFYSYLPPRSIFENALSHLFLQNPHLYEIHKNLSQNLSNIAKSI
ncbi:hypothetical protein CBFG_03051 [Clostridiales bacterium 1_7_47FAA]|nr:hypothetical protein CBFG_03051 [Clostridiales bacterium 1_7_47FAA]